MVIMVVGGREQSAGLEFCPVVSYYGDELCSDAIFRAVAVLNVTVVYCLRGLFVYLR